MQTVLQRAQTVLTRQAATDVFVQLATYSMITLLVKVVYRQ